MRDSDLFQGIADCGMLGICIHLLVYSPSICSHLLTPILPSLCPSSYLLLSIQTTVHSSIYQPAILPPLYPSVHAATHPLIYPSFYPPIYPLIHPSIRPSIHSPIYLSAYPPSASGVVPGLVVHFQAQYTSLLSWCL